MIAIQLICISMAFLAIEVSGHGMVLDPPSRSSMWRYGFPTPPNYDDNGLFCGGQQVQWEINDGNCGVCGDDFRYPQPRPNENTGKYGLGYIGQNYTQGSVIPVTVQITANHFGYFMFRLCNLTDPDTYEKEECFVDIKLANGADAYVLSSAAVGAYIIDVQLPEEVTCERCVLMWQYTAGNSWGDCGNGVGAVGCGPQETFRTCSDISIVSTE